MSTETTEIVKRKPGRPKGSKDKVPRKRRTTPAKAKEEMPEATTAAPDPFADASPPPETTTAAPDPFEGTSPPPPEPPPPPPENLEVEDDNEEPARLTDGEAHLYARLVVAALSAAYVYLGKYVSRDRPDLADEVKEIAALTDDEQEQLRPILEERLKELEVSGETALIGSLVGIAAAKYAMIQGLKRTTPVVDGSFDHE